MITAMRIAMAAAGLAALALVGGPVDGAAAKEPAKKSQKQAKAQARQAAAESASAKADGYVVRDAGKLMMRENRAGQCCN
jgi:hypothetical protein